MRDDLAQRGGAAKESRARLVLPALIIGVVLVLAGWWAYVTFIQSPEDKIRNILAGAFQAARDRNTSNVTAILSEDFKFGPLTKDDVHRALAHFLMTQVAAVDVAATPEPISVTLGPGHKTATATFRLRMRVKYDREGDWTEYQPPGVRGMEFKCSFKLTDKGWQMDGLTVSE